METKLESKVTQVRSDEEFDKLPIGSLVKISTGGPDELKVYEVFYDFGVHSFISLDDSYPELMLIRSDRSKRELIFPDPKNGVIGINHDGKLSFEYEEDNPETKKEFIKAKQLLQEAGMWRD